MLKIGFKKSNAFQYLMDLCVSKIMYVYIVHGVYLDIKPIRQITFDREKYVVLNIAIQE